MNDPGWPSPLRALLGAVFLPLTVRRRSQVDGSDLLVSLRGVFLSFVFAVLLIGSLVPVISPGADGDRSLVPLMLTIVVMASANAYLVAPRLVERPLPCENSALLADAWRSRFFLRLAFTDSIALIGLVGVVLTGRPWLYGLGAVLAAPGFLRAAPTRVRLAADQQELRNRGCALDLVAALRGSAAR